MDQKFGSHAKNYFRNVYVSHSQNFSKWTWMHLNHVAYLWGVQICHF